LQEHIPLLLLCRVEFAFAIKADFSLSISEVWNFGLFLAY
jgi:hypothetical protein